MNTNTTTRADGRKQRRKIIKVFIRDLIVIGIVFASITVNPIIPTVVGIACCIWALFGPDKAAMAITLLALVRFSNPALVSFSGNLSMVSWVLLLIAMVRYLPWGLMHVTNRLLPVMMFSLVAISLSMATSSAIDISLLKIMSFMIGALTTISIYNKMNSNEVLNVILWILALAFMVVVFSLLTLVNHDIAYNLNGVGFQGMLNHPQTLGTFLAPVTAFIAGRYVFARNDLITVELLLALLVAVLIIMSQARTAAVSAFLSVAVTVFFVGTRAINAKMKSTRSTLVKAIGGAITLLLILLLYQPAQDAMVGFIYKRDSENIEQALSSRLRGYSSQLENFMSSPIIGHGFGVYPGPTPSKGEVKYFMGIPISAAVEKGFLPTAVLEEVGLIGTIVFLYMIIAITIPVLKNKDPTWMCVYLACLFINFGEAVFFAIGGMGIFYWQLLVLSSVAARSRR